MTNRNGIFMKRIGLLSSILFAFFLFGCGSAPENQTAQPASAQAIGAGNAESGRKLFMGYAHFQNDGPPCMGCHSVGENGLLGGGVMGPDLTNVNTRLNPQEIVSFLSNSGPVISAVMQPILAEHPLSESEQADLVAFLAASSGEPETDKEGQIIAISLGGFVAAVVGLGVIYRNRLRGVRKALLKEAQAEDKKVIF